MFLKIYQEFLHVNIYTSYITFQSTEQTKTNKQINIDGYRLKQCVSYYLIYLISFFSQLTLLARDSGSPSASSETTLTVVILDVEDNDPVFRVST